MVLVGSSTKDGNPFFAGRDRCDALAVVEVNEMRKETKPIKRNNFPRWETSFSFNVTDASNFIEVSSNQQHS